MPKYFIISFIIICKSVFSQGNSIITDRPDQTESPSIVLAKSIQIENGYSVEKVNENEINTIFHTSLWRYGINDNFELRLITELRKEKNLRNTTIGLSPIKLGFKSKLTEEKGVWPAISFIGHLSLPYLSNEVFESPYFGPSFRFTFQNTLSDKIGLGYNLGAEWDGVSAEPVFIYTISSSFSISEKVGCFFELYGYLPQDNIKDHRADMGLTYYIRPNFMVDISGGIGISDVSPDQFISGGFSIRLPK
jgi:hypothetical protein